MATLNRFPIFGLWNRIAAQVLGFEYGEAACIGHGVAVLFAIRAQSGGARATKKTKQEIPVGRSDKALVTDEIAFGGDSLPCVTDDDGRVLKCLVGCQGPRDPAQTAQSYQMQVEAKIPEDLREDLEQRMRAVLRSYSKAELSGRLIYRLYDDFKVACRAGRRIDLDKLLEWLEEEAQRRQGTWSLGVSASSEWQQILNDIVARGRPFASTERQASAIAKRACAAGFARRDGLQWSRLDGTKQVASYTLTEAGEALLKHATPS